MPVTTQHCGKFSLSVPQAQGGAPEREQHRVGKGAPDGEAILSTKDLPYLPGSLLIRDTCDQMEIGRGPWKIPPGPG